MVGADTVKENVTWKDALGEFEGNGCTVTLESISEEEYEEATDRTSWNAGAADKDSGVAYHWADSTLFLHLANGKMAEYKTHTNADDGYIDYSNPDRIGPTDYFFLQVMYYEDGERKIVSGKDGKEISAMESPLLSPDHSLLLVYAQGNEMEGVAGGLQLVRLGDTATEIFNKTFDDWVPGDVKWVDDNTVYFKQYTSQQTEEEPAPRYVKMTIRN